MILLSDEDDANDWLLLAAEFPEEKDLPLDEEGDPEADDDDNDDDDDEVKDLPLA